MGFSPDFFDPMVWFQRLYLAMALICFLVIDTVCANVCLNIQLCDFVPSPRPCPTIKLRSPRSLQGLYCNLPGFVVAVFLHPLLTEVNRSEAQLFVSVPPLFFFFGSQGIHEAEQARSNLIEHLLFSSQSSVFRLAYHPSSASVFSSR